MAITAAMVKELRELTGAGMMDCKKALGETNGDMDAAVEYLRKNGQAKAEKKAGRIAAEGLCRVAVKDDRTAATTFANLLILRFSPITAILSTSASFTVLAVSRCQFSARKASRSAASELTA